ncbi:MAG: aminotransferase class I/II-fold pyridoxal phosphate-dependent enzyme [Lysobacterales bacterium]
MDTPPITSKLPQVGTTIFTVMSRLAEECGAINLSQGFPDFDGPAALRERVGWHVMHGHNQYAPMPGLPALRDAIADKVKRLYGRAVDPSREVTVTPGATEALHRAVSAAIHPGDEAIVFDPAYDTYEPSVTLNGGVCRHIPLRAPDFAVDWDRVRAAVNARTADSKYKAHVARFEQVLLAVPSEIRCCQTARIWPRMRLKPLLRGLCRPFICQNPACE